MHHLDVLLDLVRQNKGVRIGLGLRENDGLSSLSVDDKNVSKRRKSVLEWALDSQMLHCPSSLVLKVHRKVNDSDTLLHMCSCHVTYPSWNGCREKTNLQISTALLSALAQNLSKSIV